jgi:hypothetical protein
VGGLSETAQEVQVRAVGLQLTALDPVGDLDDRPVHRRVRAERRHHFAVDVVDLAAAALAPVVEDGRGGLGEDEFLDQRVEEELGKVLGGLHLGRVEAEDRQRDCLRAADELSEKGVSAEVVDLRSLRPLDTDTVLASVAKTNRVVIVEEGPLIGGWAANLLGIVASEGLHDLDDAWVIACPETPIPYTPSLEDAFLPSEGRIVHEVESRLGLRAEIATGA